MLPLILLPIPIIKNCTKQLKMEEIQVKGIENLDEKEKATLDKISSDCFKKIKRKFNDLSLKIHIKQYNVEGKRKKYSINVDALSSGKALFKANSFGWNLSIVLHDVFNKISTQAEHKFHFSDQR